MSSRWIAHLGLCAAAAILVASLGILIFQGAQSDAVPLHTLEPAQIQSGHVLNQSSDPAGAHSQSALVSHAGEMSDGI